MTCILEVSLIRLRDCKFGELASQKWSDMSFQDTDQLRVIKKEVIIDKSPAVGFRDSLGHEISFSPSLTKTIRGTGITEVFPGVLILSDGMVSPATINKWIARSRQ